MVKVALYVKISNL